MQLPTEHFRFISPGYLDAIHLPLVSGRLLSPSDEGKNYALVSELTARTLWPGRSAVGQQFSRGGVATQSSPSSAWSAMPARSLWPPAIP